MLRNELFQTREVYKIYLEKFPEDLLNVLYAMHVIKYRKNYEILEEALASNKRFVLYAPTQLHQEASQCYHYKLVNPERPHFKQENIFNKPLTDEKKASFRRKSSGFN